MAAEACAEMPQASTAGEGCADDFNDTAAAAGAEEAAGDDGVGAVGDRPSDAEIAAAMLSRYGSESGPSAVGVSKRQLRRMQLAAVRSWREGRRKRPRPEGVQGPPAPTGTESNALRRQRRDEFRALCLAGPPIVVDCDFQQLMTPKELNSLAGQLRGCWSAVKRSKRPYCLCLHSVSGFLEQELRAQGGFESWAVRCSSEPFTGAFEAARLVYLTSDSPDTLRQLRDDDVYVLGGLVDKNRHKGLTLGKARELGLRTARLPLDEVVDMRTVKTLTTMHAFDILSRVRDGAGWSEAVALALPQRKGAVALGDASSSAPPDARTQDAAASAAE